MKLVLTRPYNDSLEFKKLLEAETGNFTFIIEPLLEIEFLKKQLIIDKAAYYIITSVNSVRSLAKNTDDKALNIIAVGSSSAKEAEFLGFKNVVSATDMENHLFGEKAIITYINNYINKQNKLIHISANVTKGGIKTELKKLGHNIETIILYKSKKKQISEGLRERIVNGEQLGFIFFSPRTAAIFLSEIHEYKQIGRASCRERV